jgi:hypothetical protein
MNSSDDTCPSGVCGADTPPLVGSVLTGTGLTLHAAAARLAAGEALPPMSDVQRRLVEVQALGEREAKP